MQKKRSLVSIKVVDTIQNKSSLLLTGFILTVLVALLCYMRPAFFDYMLYKIYDIHLQNHHRSEQTHMPIVVDIDDASLKAYGQWPWPRYRISRLMEKIKASGVLSIGIDILFAEPDRTSLSTIDASMKKYFKDSLGRQQSVIAEQLPEIVMDNDKTLAQTFSKGGFVLGYTFSFGNENNIEDARLIKPLNAAIIETPGATDISGTVYTPSGVIPPLELLSTSAKNTGFFNTTPDHDGVLRATPLFMLFNGKLYPNLSLATLLAALGNPQVAVKLDQRGVQSMRIGPLTVPLDEAGRFYVHFRGAGNQFKTIPAAQFLENKIAPGSLKGKIAIVGTSAAGLKDLKATPLDPELMGAQVHTTVIDNILKKDFILWPKWYRGAEIFMVFLFGGLTTLAIVWARPWMTLVFSFLISLVIWQCSVYAFREKQMFLSPLYSFIILGLNFSVLALLKFYFSEKKRLFLKKAFSNYVSDDLIEDIVRHPEMLKLGGQVKTASVLFCDLKNFTNISEARTPHEIVDIMSRYFEEMTRYVFKYKGSLKEYIGDEMMALFGAPLSAKDHAVNACHAALESQAFLSRLRQGNDPSGLPPLYARTGVNTGEMLIGNIGSKFRFSYGAMGDNVNLGSRLEGLNKIYGTKIIIGQNTARYAKDHFRLRMLGAVAVKGKTRPEQVYELIAGKDDRLEDNHLFALDCYETGYNHYKKQEWDKAIENFTKAHALWPKDISCQVMIQRCTMYKQMDYIENFDGVFIERRK